VTRAPGAVSFSVLEVRRRRALWLWALAGSPLLAARLAAQGPAPAAHYYNPAWSPDGKSIAYESDVSGKFAVYVVALAGGAPRRLTSAGADDVQPAFSPDGKHIVFTSNRDGHDQLYDMAVDGSAQRRLAQSATGDFYASYSPDGSEILFSAQDPRNRMLYFVGVIRADGSQRRLLTDSTVSVEGPRWTRDGTGIVASRVPLLERKAGESARDFIARRKQATERLVIPRAGSRAPRVVPAAAAPAPLDPALSPDRSEVAEIRDAGPASEVVITNRQTGSVTRRIRIGG
jgi:dipeptidyl aminopeptidase/acylaminoacyl peptidase